MSFLSFSRAAWVRGLFWAGILAASRTAHAQQLSSAAPELDFSAEIEPRWSARAQIPTLRASRPVLPGRIVPRVGPLPIAPPPDTFGQTPAQLQSWLLNLAKARPQQVKTRILGRTPGGRPLIALEITPSGASPWKLRRLAVVCRQHGNEPEASASGARFIREFLTTTDARQRALSRRTALLIVPIANPDGAAVYRRRTNAKVDMNRDWGRFRAPETRLLAAAIAAWKPNLVVDVHQWLPDETQPPPMAEASGGALARQTAQRMASENAGKGYWLAARSRWGLDTLCHRFWGQRFKIPAILLESRHRPTVPGARQVAIGTSITALWAATESVAK